MNIHWIFHSKESMNIHRKFDAKQYVNFINIYMYSVDTCGHIIMLIYNIVT